MNPVRIHQLDNILANQIAAGEVVERPASVVKELIENAIDAAATRVDIEVEKGGASLIRVKDNGSGIHPEDLTLALSRHATSKIHQTEDLSAIKSLGFRGEALASISSVSKLSLISKWYQADTALKAEAEGRDMEVSISPAGLTQGTLVEVRDLFFNTPARRRFMRTDKTEFRNIETVVSRVALSHPQINFMLKHNGKKVKHFIAAQNRLSEEQRVAQILGKEFIQNCVHFDLTHKVDNGDIHFSGWVGLPNYHRSMNDGQFVFINSRPVKDAVVSHAIREAYAQLIPPGRLPAYIIDIEMDAETVDVNVHPTKHEVRFQHQRMVHDLIIRAVSEVINEGVKSKAGHSKLEPSSLEPSFSKSYSQPNSKQVSTVEDQSEIYTELVKSANEEDASFTFLVGHQWLLIPIKQQLVLISIEELIKQQLHTKQPEISPILFPQDYSITTIQAEFLLRQQDNLKRLGLEFFIEDNNQFCKLLTIPNILAGVDIETIFKAAIADVSKHKFVAGFIENLLKNKEVCLSIIEYHNLNNQEDAMQWLSGYIELGNTNLEEITFENQKILKVISSSDLKQWFQHLQR